MRTLLILLVAAAPAFGHKLLVQPKVSETQVRVEAYYEDETPAQHAKVEVWRGDEMVASGTTDDTGVWTFAKPPAGTYEIRVKDLGHAARLALVIEEAAPPPDPPRQSGVRWGPLLIGLAIIGFLTLFPRLWRMTRRR